MKHTFLLMLLGCFDKSQYCLLFRLLAVIQLALQLSLLFLEHELP